MGFIRVKKIKEKEYAYFVENEWTNLGSRQRVKKYLGRVFRPDKIKSDYSEIPDREFIRSVKELAKQELINHGFDSSLSRADFRVDLNKGRVYCKKRNAVIAMNEGFLCEETIHNLFSFEARGHEEEVGLKLATQLVEMGLQVPKEIFVSMFNKIYKGEEDLKAEDE